MFVSTRLTGKLEGIAGVTTSCLECEYCKTMQKSAEKHPEIMKGSVCTYCYARKASKRKFKCWALYKENTANLSEYIPDDELPDLRWNNAGTPLCRFNTHGELVNLANLDNYYRIARKNPYFTFALWTKRWDLIRDGALSGIRPPENLTIVLSSLLLNRPLDDSPVEMLKVHGIHVDTVFTVYTKEYIEEHGVDINCGGRKCADCRLCYGHHDETMYIREELKR